MTINNIGNGSVSNSILEMGQLLKDINSARIGLEDKMMKVSVEEQVEQATNLGNNIDISA